MDTGSDVDYGALTRLLIGHLQTLGGFAVNYSQRVTDLDREPDGGWRVEVEDTESGERRELVSKFVFLGAGGGALPLLQRSRIPEADGYAGFPVSGIWLRCDNETVAARHNAKVYGLASVGSPPMSVPHLDTRIIDAKRSLLFGPYAGFSTKFLKHGSLLDLFRSLNLHNIEPMLFVARDNFGLTEYLVKQVLETNAERFAELQSYFPNAERADWRQQVAGQRVQIIKRDPTHGGILEFGTEIVASADHSLIALLGASPGASTAAWIMLRIVDMCFKTEPAKLREIVPSYGESLIDNPELCRRVRADTAAVLGLHDIDRSVHEAQPPNKESRRWMTVKNLGCATCQSASMRAATVAKPTQWARLTSPRIATGERKRSAVSSISRSATTTCRSAFITLTAT